MAAGIQRHQGVVARVDFKASCLHNLCPNLLHAPSIACGKRPAWHWQVCTLPHRITPRPRAPGAHDTGVGATFLCVEDLPNNCLHTWRPISRLAHTIDDQVTEILVPHSRSKAPGEPTQDVSAPELNRPRTIGKRGSVLVFVLKLFLLKIRP